MSDQEVPAEIRDLIEQGFESSDLAPFETYSGKAFHYTSAEGLHGILQRKELWLQDLRDMSDRSEIIYSWSHVVDSVHEYRKEGPPEEPFNSFLERLEHGLKEAFQVFGYYASCASLDGDKLSQWRSYACDGAGFAVGLEINPSQYVSFDKLPADIRTWTFCFKVVYDIEMLKEKTKDYLKAAEKIFFSDKIRNYCSGGKDNIVAMAIQLSSTITANMMTDAVRYKHPKFAEEEEVRILLCNERGKLLPHVRVRRQSDRFKSYIPTPLHDDIQLSEIVIGPATHEDTPYSLQDLLREIGVTSGCTVSHSVIPYRP